MKKNKHFIILMLGTVLVGAGSCEPQSDPLEHEQYQKEVYLVGAAQDIQDREVPYDGDGSSMFRLPSVELNSQVRMFRSRLAWQAVRR